jgi:hemerythrin-like domain-containing protein
MIISHYMKGEHRACDEHFAEAEKAVIEGDFDKAQELFVKFAEDTLGHFAKEEEILFPEFEEVTGSTEGPTNMMRYEHEQMRDLIGRMAGAVEEQDKDAYLSIAESMMILLQQHNMKEEQMLYAMCDRVIPQQTKEETVEKLKKA